MEQCLYHTDPFAAYRRENRHHQRHLDKNKKDCLCELQNAKEIQLQSSSSIFACYWTTQWQFLQNRPSLCLECSGSIQARRAPTCIGSKDGSRKRIISPYLSVPAHLTFSLTSLFLSCEQSNYLRPHRLFKPSMPIPSLAHSRSGPTPSAHLHSFTLALPNLLSSPLPLLISSG